MSAMIDLHGKRFGDLVVTARAASVNGRAAWDCACDCGAKLVVIGQLLRRKMVTSCGCAMKRRAEVMGRKNRTHGKSDTPEFRVWTNMLARCTNPKDSRFKRYGGRGITVCDAWITSFETFLRDMGPVPFPGAELDREKNDQGYSPSNCRWVTAKVNQNNKATNRLIEFRGRTQSMSLWAEEFGINLNTLRCRLESGWSIEDAFTRPVRAHTQYRSFKHAGH
jgi:hypothetical protein